MDPCEIEWIEHDEMCTVVEIMVPMKPIEDCSHSNLGIHPESGWKEKARRAEPYMIRCSDCKGSLMVMFTRKDMCKCGSKVKWDGEFSYTLNEYCN